MELIEALNWRYAVKKMNGKQVPADKVENILEAIRLSVSSAGLQPYQVIVVDDHILKGKIHELAIRQPQAVEGSHILIFAPWLTVDEGRVDTYMKRIADTRGVTIESLIPFSDAIKGGILSKTPAARADWAARQAYIALGFGVVAAAVEGVDATPMEGFDGPELDKLLGLEEKGLHSVAVLILGYRDTERDYLSSAKKVRQKRDELFITAK